MTNAPASPCTALSHLGSSRVQQNLGGLGNPTLQSQHLAFPHVLLLHVA